MPCSACAPRQAKVTALAARGFPGGRICTPRGSAVVRLALAEATVPQIATFTGHSLKDVEATSMPIISVVIFSSLKRRS